MKKAAWILCCVLTANLLCGCSPRFLPQPKDISNVELVRTLAVDSAPEERVKVTVSSGVKQEESGQRRQRAADSGTGGGYGFWPPVR